MCSDCDEEYENPEDGRTLKHGFRLEEHADNVQHCQNAVGDGRLRSGLGRCETR